MSATWAPRIRTATVIAVFVAGACSPVPPGPTVTPSSHGSPAAGSAGASSAPADAWRLVENGGAFDGLAIGSLVGTPDRWLEFAQDRSTLRPVVLASADGSKWTRRPGRTAFGSNPPVAVVMGRNVIVALAWEVTAIHARMAAWISRDGGDTWLLDPSTTGRFPLLNAAMAGGESGFLIYGSDGYTRHAYLSPNGVTWTEVADSELTLGDGWVFNDAAATGDGFIAVGTVGTDEQPSASVWTTSDGLRWARTPVDADGLDRIVRVGSTTVVVGWRDAVSADAQSPDQLVGLAFSSTDRHSWDEDTLEGIATFPFETVRTATASYAVARSRGALSRSSDGIHWTAAGPPDLTALRAAARGDTVLAFLKGKGGIETWVAGRESTPNSAAPSSGPLDDLDPASPIAAWQAVDASSLGSPAEDLSLLHVAAWRSVIVATGSTPGAVWASPDGRHWRRARAQPALDGVVVSALGSTASGFVAFADRPSGASHRLLLSRDGEHWSSAPYPAVFRRAVIAGMSPGRPGEIVAFGAASYTDEQGGVPAVWTSTDRRHWREVILPSGGATGRAVGAAVDRAGSGRWIVVRELAHPDGILALATWTSTNGTTWERFDATVDGDFASGTLISTAFGFLVVAGPDGEQILRHLDAGGTWSPVSPSSFGAVPAIAAVRRLGDGLIAVGAHRVLNAAAPAAWWSPDATRWFEVDPTSLSQPAAEPPARAEISDAVVTASGVVAVGFVRHPVVTGVPAAHPSIWLSGTETSALPSRVCSSSATTEGLIAMAPGDRVACYGRRQLRLHGYLMDATPDCEGAGSQDSRLNFCHVVGLATLPTQDPASTPILRLDPTSVAANLRPGFVDLVGHFDDSRLETCTQTRPEDVAVPAAWQTPLLMCREQLTVTSIRQLP
jgi:hypothetical protein